MESSIPRVKETLLDTAEHIPKQPLVVTKQLHCLLGENRNQAMMELIYVTASRTTEHRDS